MEDNYSMGIEYYKNKEYEKAYEFFEKEVGSNENNHKAWNSLGVTCKKLGRTEDAVICFENALTLYPDSAVYKKNLEICVPHDKKPASEKKPTPPLTKKYNRVSGITLKNKVIATFFIILVITIIVLIISSGSLFNSAIEASHNQISHIIPSNGTNSSQKVPDPVDVLSRINDIQVIPPGGPDSLPIGPSSTNGSINGSSGSGTPPRGSHSQDILNRVQNIQVTAPGGESISLTDSASSMLKNGGVNF